MAIDLEEMKISRHILVYGSLLCFLVAGGTQVLAEGHGEEESLGQIDVIATGTRIKTRSVHESPAPIDIVDTEELRGQGTSDVADLVRNIVPSFNVNTQSIADASTLVRPINLRGLPSDHALVLVNGKRRHRASVIHWNSGNNASKGAQGPDISVIPAIALDRVEILRDGASAQYGSDAIAGVMNFILKDDANGGTFEAKYGQYDEESSENLYVLTGNIGLPIANRGFINASFEYGEADETDRSSPRTDALDLIMAGNSRVNPVPQNWGSPEVESDLKTFFNLGMELGDNKELYSFGNYASKEVEGSFFFRNPGTLGGGREGVFVDSGDAGGNHLIADLTGNCDKDAARGQISADGRVGSGFDTTNCFSFNQRFPGGFTPRFGADVEDVSVVAGLRGDLDNGFSYDLSASWGQNDADFFIYNTVNASLGPDSPTSFDPGDYTQTEYHINADFSYPVEVASLASDLNIAGGLEYRVEDFKINAGEDNSWIQGPYTTDGYSTGSNGFPGFSTDISGDWDRENYAMYLDMETNVTDRWLIGAALRYEDFDDFGSTTNGKLSTRFDVTDQLGLRATFSTGFRAPTPGQSNASNISTSCIANEEGGCTLVNQGTIPSNSAVAQAVGASELEEEESTNWGAGLVFQGQNWGITIDYFNIEVDDRIALSREFSLTDEQKQRLIAEGVTGARDLKEFRFFINDLDTENEGVDVVVSHTREWDSAGVTDFSLAYNYTDTKVKSYTPGILDTNRIKELEDSLPQRRFNATAIHQKGDWQFLLRYNWTDDWYDGDIDESTYDSYWTMDTEVNYFFNDNITMVVGGTNFTDETPDKSTLEDAVGQRYNSYAPLGFDGAFYYARLMYKF